MRIKIKIIAFLLLPILVVTLLTGCSGKKYKGLKLPAKDAFSEQLSPSTITMLLPGYEPDGWKDVKKALEQKLEPTLNVKLNFQWTTEGSYKEKLKYIEEHGNTLDALVVSKDSNQDDMQQMLNDGMIKDITPYLEKDGKRLREVYSTEELANVMYNGKIAALPAHFPRSNRVIFSISETMLKYLYFDDGTTSDNIKISNLEDALRFVLETDGAPLMTDLTTLPFFAEPAGYVNIGYGLVYKIDDPEIKIIPGEKTEEFKAGVKVINDLQRDGKCNANYWYQDGSGTLVPHETLNDYFSRNYNGFFFCTYDELQNYTHFMGFQNDAFRITPIIRDKPSTISLNTEGIAIYKGSKHADRVVQFLQWLQTSEENYDLFMYGIQGTYYNLESGKLSFPRNKNRYYGWDGSKAFLNIDFMREEAYDKDGYKEEYKDIVLKQSKYPPTTGFHIDISKIENQLKARVEDLNMFELRLRSVEFTTVDEEIEKLNDQQTKNDIYRVISEVQKQVDEWKNSKKQ